MRALSWKAIMPPPPKHSAAPVRATRWTAIVASALAAAVALGIGWWIGGARSAAPARQVSRLLIDVRPAEFLLGALPFEQQPLGRSRPSRTAIALSPDGRTIAFTAHRKESQLLYIRSFDQDQARPLSGTHGADEPFFSADGAWVGFWSGGSLMKAALAGGPPVKLADSGLPPMGASWAEEDRIVFEQGRRFGAYRRAAVHRPS